MMQAWANFLDQLRSNRKSTREPVARDVTLSNSPPTTSFQLNAVLAGVADSAEQSTPPHRAVDVPRRHDSGLTGSGAIRQRQKAARSGNSG